MSSNLKTEVSSSDFPDFEAETLAQPSKRTRLFRLLDTTRLAITLLSLAFGIVILGVSADALVVYKSTHLPEDFNLPLWPQAFNVNPIKAMVAAGTVVVASKTAVLLVSKVGVLRGSFALTTATNLLVPAICFTVAVIATIFHFVVGASSEVDTVHSWSCRWRHTVMLQEPYFGTLCRESKAGVALVVALVPLELTVAFVAVVQIVMAKGFKANFDGSRKSPTPS